MPADTMNPPEAKGKRRPRKGGKPKAPKPADTRPKSLPPPPDWEAAFAQTVNEIKSVADTALRFTQDPTCPLSEKLRQSRQLLSDIYIKIDDLRASDAFHAATITSKNHIDTIEAVCHNFEYTKNLFKEPVLPDYDDTQKLIPATASAVGKAFAGVREAKGLSKAQLQRESGIDRTQAGQLEKGRYSPTLESVRRYADALGYDVRIMLIEKGKPQP